MYIKQDLKNQIHRMYNTYLATSSSPITILFQIHNGPTLALLHALYVDQINLSSSSHPKTSRPPAAAPPLPSFWARSRCLSHIAPT